MRFGTYPKRNCALHFLYAKDYIFTPNYGGTTYSLLESRRIIHALLHDEVAIFCTNVILNFLPDHNRPNPSALDRNPIQNLRTIIVIADIDEGFGQSAPDRVNYLAQPPLTFSHRSGVTPYTSSCELAGSCVFGKQSPEILSLRPFLRRAGLIANLRPLFCRVP